MKLQNGYKVIYDKAINGEHAFYASKTGAFIGADEIETFVEGEYKLIYEKDGKFYGSTTGIPTSDDYCFEQFNKVFEIETETEVEEPVSGEESPVEVEEPVVEETEE